MTKDETPTATTTRHGNVPDQTTPFNEIFTTKNASLWKNPAYWRAKCPDATISSSSSSPAPSPPSALPPSTLQKIPKLLHNQGYALIPPLLPTTTAPAPLITTLATTIKTLTANGAVPATFVILYDETWHLAYQHYLPLLTAATHPSNKFNYDILAWSVDPRRSQSGFSPHRDRQPSDLAASFHRDEYRSAKYVTAWIALTDATPENSCLYVIPKGVDPGYDGEGDVDDVDPLRRVLDGGKGSYQNIRAVPRQAGEGVVFTHRIIHWGSRGGGDEECCEEEEDEREPRIAISFVVSDGEFEAPYLSLTEGEIPSFEVRLLLVCSQLLIYYQRFDLSRSVIRTCYEYCKEHELLLEEGYRKKVFVEFVKAMKETMTTTDADATATANEELTTATRVGKEEPDDACDNDKEDDDGEEMVLEEMLNAEEGGYGEFDDDFDGLDENGENGGGFDGCDDDDDFDDDDEEADLFGKKRITSSKDSDCDSDMDKKMKLDCKKIRRE